MSTVIFITEAAILLKNKRLEAAWLFYQRNPLHECCLQRFFNKFNASQNQRQGASPAASASERLTVLVVGNSLAAGYGLSHPALLQKADSAGLGRVEVVNAGVSGETTAGGRGRIDWLLRRKDLDVLLLELGGNDALRGPPP